MKTIKLGGETYNAQWLRTVSEHDALRRLHKHDQSQVRNAWKQANGLSVRNHSKEAMIEQLVKSNKMSELKAKAEELGLEFESDANKKTIATLIVNKQQEGKE